MKVTRFYGTLVEVEAYINYAGEHDIVYLTYAVDEMPPMNNELYEKYKADVVMMIQDDIRDRNTQLVVDKIYFEGFEDSPLYALYEKGDKQ